MKNETEPVSEEVPKTWYSASFSVARPSLRTVVVTVWSKENTHAVKLARMPGGKRNVLLDKTADDTAYREHPEETGVPVFGPLRLIAQEWRSGPRIEVPHWYSIFRARDMTDEFLDRNLEGMLNGAEKDGVISLATAKALGKEHEFIGMKTGRKEIASPLTVQEILDDVRGEKFVPYHRLLLEQELRRILAE